MKLIFLLLNILVRHENIQPFKQNRDFHKNGILISICRSGDVFQSGLFKFFSHVFCAMFFPFLYYILFLNALKKKHKNYKFYIPYIFVFANYLLEKKADISISTLLSPISNFVTYIFLKGSLYVFIKIVNTYFFAIKYTRVAKICKYVYFCL